MVTDNEYYDALNSAEESPHYYKSDRNRLLFSRLIYRHGIFPEAIDELKFKLSFTNYEWYLWSLLLISMHNGEDDFDT